MWTKQLSKYFYILTWYITGWLHVPLNCLCVIGSRLKFWNLLHGHSVLSWLFYKEFNGQLFIVSPLSWFLWNLASVWLMPGLKILYYLTSNRKALNMLSQVKNINILKYHSYGTDFLNKSFLMHVCLFIKYPRQTFRIFVTMTALGEGAWGTMYGKDYHLSFFIHLDC